MPIQHAVTIPQREFEELPALLAQELARLSLLPRSGFRVVDRETGAEITERLDHWFAGVTERAWGEVLKRVGEENRGTY